MLDVSHTGSILHPWDEGSGLTATGTSRCPQGPQLHHCFIIIIIITAVLHFPVQPSWMPLPSSELVSLAALIGSDFTLWK